MPIAEELEYLYKRTLNDNKDDLFIIMNIINKLCAYLFYKNIINQEEQSEILKIDKDKGVKE